MTLTKVWNTGELCFTITTSKGRELSYKVFKGEVYNYIGTPIQDKSFKTALKNLLLSEGKKYLKIKADRLKAEIKRLEKRISALNDLKQINFERRNIKRLNYVGNDVNVCWSIIIGLKKVA